jgi:hypothetical protein
MWYTNRSVPRCDNNWLKNKRTSVCIMNLIYSALNHFWSDFSFCHYLQILLTLMSCHHRRRGQASEQQRQQQQQQQGNASQTVRCNQRVCGFDAALGFKRWRYRPRESDSFDHRIRRSPSCILTVDVASWGSLVAHWRSAQAQVRVRLPLPPLLLQAMTQ